MKINPSYTRTLINGIPYLIPYGQQAADFSKALKLNETADLLLSHIISGADEDELLNVISKAYDSSWDNPADLKQEISDYINVLKINNIIMSDNSPNYSGMNARHIRIGDLNIALSGADKLCEQYFSDFSCEPPAQSCHQTIQVLTYHPYKHINGNILVRNKELIVSETNDSYVIIFLSSNVYELISSKDGNHVSVYCKDNQSDEAVTELFHAIRFAFLILAMANDKYILHSASILYKGKAWLFSGMAGTGKSTHTNIWRDNYNTPILNGDLNMIGFHNGSAVVYGLPWCGTSGIHSAETHPLGGIAFLRQAPYDRVIIPDRDEKILFFVQRLISPSWTQSHIENSLKFAEAVLDSVPFFRLLCTKNPSAADVMKTHIDTYCI